MIPEAIGTCLPSVLDHLLARLGDNPKIVNQSLFALSEIPFNFGKGAQKSNMCPLSNVLKKAVDAMFAVTERPDVFNDETPLFSSSMASMCEWIEHAPNDQLQMVQNMLGKLYSVVFMSYFNEMDQNKREQKIDGLSGLINTCVNRLERRVQPNMYVDILKM